MKQQFRLFSLTLALTLATGMAAAATDKAPDTAPSKEFYATFVPEGFVADHSAVKFALYATLMGAEGEALKFGGICEMVNGSPKDITIESGACLTLIGNGENVNIHLPGEDFGQKLRLIAGNRVLAVGVANIGKSQGQAVWEVQELEVFLLPSMDYTNTRAPRIASNP